MTLPRTVAPETAPSLCICTAVDDLEEGLFGQVLLWVFELLPWLDGQGLRAEWDIRSRLYGAGAQHRVLPGVFDAVGPGPGKGVLPRRSLLWLRTGRVSVLGNDWTALHQLWQRHFAVPPRVLARAEAVGLPPACLGLHFRGTDKNRASLDTNPVSVDEFLSLVAAFLAERPGLASLFVASDEPGLLDRVRARWPQRQVFGLGDVPFHKGPADGPDKADRALLDCLLLSRCEVVLKSSSALSGFAKVLNPDLEIYRFAASKVFTEVPYFPDAWIPPLRLRDPAAESLLQRLMAGDWSQQPGARAWGEVFMARRRYGPARVRVNQLKSLASLLLRGRLRRA